MSERQKGETEGFIRLISVDHIASRIEISVLATPVLSELQALGVAYLTPALKDRNALLENRGLTVPTGWSLNSNPFIGPVELKRETRSLLRGIESATSYTEPVEVSAKDFKREWIPIYLQVVIQASHLGPGEPDSQECLRAARSVVDDWEKFLTRPISLALGELSVGPETPNRKMLKQAYDTRRNLLIQTLTQACNTLSLAQEGRLAMSLSILGDYIVKAREHDTLLTTNLMDAAIGTGLVTDTFEKVALRVFRQDKEAADHPRRLIGTAHPPSNESDKVVVPMIIMPGCAEPNDSSE